MIQAVITTQLFKLALLSYESAETVMLLILVHYTYMRMYHPHCLPPRILIVKQSFVHIE